MKGLTVVQLTLKCQYLQEIQISALNAKTNKTECQETIIRLSVRETKVLVWIIRSKTQIENQSISYHQVFLLCNS